ncbi:cellulase [Mycena pura]|uniref:Glucanase n=1 Tax=Mycena pura TaxID=153505 RepID=A0AAD6YMB7_9AGAR|nr:cellulase [Mycena pura]
MLSAVSVLSLAGLVASQQIGTIVPEVHPPITYETCTVAGGCATQSGSIVLDANFRFLHDASGDTCNPSSGFNRTICPNAATCGEACALEGADYATTFGVSTSGDTLSLVFGNGGSRVYLLDSTGNYADFRVMGKEFTFDVNVGNLPCGYNGALYFSEMPLDGGKSAINEAGATYGTGYCDSQCPKGINFLNGTVNVDGSLGSCCNEMDLWEANSVATQLTPHPCNVTGEFACSGSTCGRPLCDPSGCDFNPFRMGNQSFYGPGKIVDTNQVMTVVTQFVTDDGTPEGTLTAIKRIYVQNGVVIQNSNIAISGLPQTNAMTQELCSDKISVLGDDSAFNTFGGLAGMGKSLARSAVLVISLWDDLSGGMIWLDGLEGSNPSAPGALRGPCPAPPAKSDPQASVTFSRIRVGELGSTFKGSAPAPPPTTTSAPSSTTSTSTSTTTSSGPQQTHWGQCGGQFYSGPTTCAAPFSCVFSNPFYSQCL